MIGAGIVERCDTVEEFPHLGFACRLADNRKDRFLHGSRHSRDTGWSLSRKRLTIELPLKLLICEGDDGQSLLSYHAPDSLARGYELTEDESDTLRVVDGIARHTWSNRLV